MGEDVDILRKMDIGQLEGCGCTALGILTACPEISALLLPGLFKNYDEVEYITEKFRKQINAYSEKRGYILAALIDTGFFNVYSKNKITCLDDLKKFRILTWIGPVETSLYKELGINATPVAVPEVVAALSTGLQTHVWRLRHGCSVCRPINMLTITFSNPFYILRQPLLSALM